MTPGFPWLVLLLLGNPAAGAGAIQDGPQGEASAALAFQFVGCADDLVHDVEELIRADVAWAPGDPPVALTVRCEPAGVTLLLAGDDGRGTERKLDFASTPSQARARTAALVATELILMGRRSPPPVLRRAPEAGAVGDEPVARATLMRPGEDRSPPPGRRDAALLAVVGSSLQQAASDVPLFAAGARGRLAVARVLDLAADAVALYQRRTSVYGTSQALGGQVSLLGEARLRVHGGAARAGLGARAIGLRVAGSRVAEALVARSSAWGSSVGPMVRLAISAEGRPVVGELALEGGWSGPEVVGTAGGGSPIGTGGWWAGVSVAVGWTSGVD